LAFVGKRGRWGPKKGIRGRWGPKKGIRGRWGPKKGIRGEGKGKKVLQKSFPLLTFTLFPKSAKSTNAKRSIVKEVDSEKTPYYLPL
jgi:hypothetical protein